MNMLLLRVRETEGIIQLNHILMLENLKVNILKEMMIVKTYGIYLIIMELIQELIMIMVVIYVLEKFHVNHNVKKLVSI